jgi:hypothetical protein
MLGVISNNWLLIVALGVLGLIGLASVLKRNAKPPSGLPLPVKTAYGLFRGKPEAWETVRGLLDQPGPPDPREPLKQAIREVIAEDRKKAV